MFAQSPASATSVRSRSRPASINSSAWRPWLSCVAAIGSPPMMREIMIGRAVPPEPAIAPSTHVLPVAFQASANLPTAAASPPEVHQWVTSSSTPSAADTVAVAAVSAVPNNIDFNVLDIFSSQKHGFEQCTLKLRSTLPALQSITY